MTTPADMIREAAEAEAMAQLVSYAKDRQWLLAKAAQLRRQAARAEQLAKRDGDPPPPDRG